MLYHAHSATQQCSSKSYIVHSSSRFVTIHISIIKGKKQNHFVPMLPPTQYRTTYSVNYVEISPPLPAIQTITAYIYTLDATLSDVHVARAIKLGLLLRDELSTFKLVRLL